MSEVYYFGDPKLKPKFESPTWFKQKIMKKHETYETKLKDKF